MVTAADQAAGSFTSGAMLTGTPPEGDGAAVTGTSNTLTASLPAAAPAHTSTPASSSPTSGVLGFKSTSVPSLVGPRACVRGGFRVTLKSAGLARVTFYLDGHKLKVLTARNARKGLISIVINPSKLTVGRHKILARITMANSSVHATRTLIISRCK